MFSINGTGLLDIPARPLWSGECTPVAVGGSKEEDIRTVQEGQLRLAVAGSCFAEEFQLREGLEAVRAGR